LGEPLSLLYRSYPEVGASDFHDFEVTIERPAGLRRVLRPQARFRFDGVAPFEALPLAHAFPMLEWGMNWCISSQVNSYLLIHAAVVERGGRAAVLPAPPGSGKSTLCAALVHRGWRLLSDEIAVVELDGSAIHPLVRPVSLKNRSIQVIASFEPAAVFSRPVPETSKGTVAHMRAPPAHVQRMGDTAVPAWIVFQKWKEQAAARLTLRDRADTVVDLARNSFNYGTLGKSGFEAMTRLVRVCECRDFEYGHLDDAIAVFESLAGQK
jgi:HprK-related kinase A